ncbi:MAG TPA: DUF3300 domain-containing protein [Candidatus Angelobacter sp.]|nr:DUF3300 domain-containing protein [Candidatus Angelobacter sp.]
MFARKMTTKQRQVTARVLMIALSAIMMCCTLAAPAMAQDQDQPPPPSFSPQQLDNLVSRVALHPDPLLAQILAAATFPDQIPDATKWADQHHYLTGDELAQAISNDQLPWDPSVQALLPFPTVLEQMANDMNWTTDIGNAFLSQQQDVMDAVQRMRQKARDFGYLATNQQIVVSGGPYITILPARPDYLVVPYYDPLVVYARPRPGFFVGAGISFRFGVGLGVAFRPWGWGYNRIAWDRRTVFINNAPWGRTWVNRREYVHPYAVRRTVVGNRPVERHELIERSERERSAGRYGHERVEEHRNDHRGRDNRGRDEHDHR